MGGLCSKCANKSDDPFSRPGRVLGSNNAGASGPSDAASATPRAPVPSQASRQRPIDTIPGRTLGGGGGMPPPNEARNAAARAAEERANKQAAGQGKLGKKLASQKTQTRTETLNEASRTERAARQADEARPVQTWE